MMMMMTSMMIFQIIQNVNKITANRTSVLVKHLQHEKLTHKSIEK